MGPMLPIVNPVLWEIGHVGWFHEYWTLRHAHGAGAAARARGPPLEFEHGRARHALGPGPARPQRRVRIHGGRAGAAGRPAGRRGRCPGSYFYELSIRHEDMHVEALAYTRQTLGYARPDGLGAPAIPPPGLAGRRRRAGRTWRLGSTPADGFVFDNEKWAHEVAIAPFRIAKAPVTNAEFAAFIDAGGYRRREFWSADGLGLARARGRRAAGLLAREGRRQLDLAALPEGRAAPAACAGDVRQLVRGRGLVPLGQAPAADRGRMGGGRAGRAERGWLPLGRAQATLAVGRGAAETASMPTSISHATDRSMSPPAPRATAPAAAGR